MHIHIFRLCPINSFEINAISKELVGQNLSIHPPINVLDPSVHGVYFGPLKDLVYTRDSLRYN